MICFYYFVKYYYAPPFLIQILFSIYLITQGLMSPVTVYAYCNILVGILIFSCANLYVNTKLSLLHLFSFRQDLETQPNTDRLPGCASRFSNMENLKTIQDYCSHVVRKNVTAVGRLLFSQDRL